MSRITSDPDKGDPFNRDDSLELDRLDNNHNHQAAANRYQIDPLSDSSDSDNDDDLDAIDEHHTLTGKKEALLKKHLHTDDHHHHPTSSTSSDDSNLSQSHHHDTDTDTIDVHIIPLSSSEAIDRQRGDLQKNVTFSNGLTLVVGVIIGSGIFASPGPVFAYSKSVGVSLIIWFVSGLLAFAGSLCYAELGSAMPSSGGGEHAYLNHAFGSLPAFLFSWSSIALLKPAGNAIICVVFAEYVVNIVAQSSWDPTQPMRHWSNKLIAIACVLVLSGLNSISVSVGTRIQDVFTFIKVVTLLVIGIAGLVVLGQKSLSSHNFDHAFEGTSQPSLGDIALGLYSGLWAYDGWNNLNYVSSEMKNPTRDLPRVIFAGVPIVIIFYLLANTAYYAVLPEEVVMNTNTVAIDFGKQMFGSTGGVLFAICVACSCFGAANGSIFTGARVIYASAREGYLPKMFGKVSEKRRTPVAALGLQAVMTTIMILGGTFSTLVNFYSVAAWLFYLSSILGLLYLRYHEPNLKRPFKVWMVVPILFTFFGLFLFLMPFVRAPLESCLSMVIVLSGLPLWVVKELVSGNRGTRWQDLKEKVMHSFGIAPAGGRHERLAG
ncbi:amino acid permease-domain-containing protein [Linnemannia elongata]|nr:amino acid permease-domain-containing protein [Linnemannia elongata]KAK5814337.1 amino acid permease-domain-containing protein [Linnemannia elongata]